MAKAFDPSKWKYSSLCAKHPELNGLRMIANSTCFQCSRDGVARIQEKRRLAAGKEKFVLQSAEQAKQRIKEKGRLRSIERRKNDSYNAMQITRKREWRKKNRDIYLATNRAYEAKHLAENIQRRLSKNLRNRLRKAMVGETRGLSGVRDLGISITEFRAYFASKFKEGMSWNNYGTWHIDHIIPLISFDLTKDDQVKKACHFTNLQPLWASENHSKGKKMPFLNLGVA